MNPWIVRIIAIILAVALVPLIVSGTASLVADVIQSAGEGIHSLFTPFAMSGEARLQGIIRLCLYLISITLLIRFLFGKKGGG